MRSVKLLIICIVTLVSAIALAQSTTTIRLSSTAPPNSLFDRVLKQMASEWRKVTDGRVTLRVISGGAIGDESTIIRRMRLNNPQAAAITQLGLAEIHDAFNVFGIPFFFESDEELLHVLERLTPELTEALGESGLVLLGWGHTGWAHFFTAEPVQNLEDLRRTKIFTSAGDDVMVRWYKENGFEPVPLALTDVLMGLNTGLIDAYPSPPYAALLFQWYRQTPHMLDVALAPVIAATVMTERSWRRLSETDRQAILKSAKGVQNRLWTEVPQQDREAVEAMIERGLTVATVSADEERAFRTLADEMTASWRGRIVPAEIFDVALRERDAFRAKRVAFAVPPNAIPTLNFH